MTGKREPDLVFLKAVHKKLNIGGEFLLTHADPGLHFEAFRFSGFMPVANQIRR
jgi:hypothetical protein